jgi:50S ribosomal subunit-associated GTPase HflX
LDSDPDFKLYRANLIQQEIHITSIPIVKVPNKDDNTTSVSELNREMSLSELSPAQNAISDSEESIEHLTPMYSFSVSEKLLDNKPTKKEENEEKIRDQIKELVKDAIKVTIKTNSQLLFYFYLKSILVK